MGFPLEDFVRPPATIHLDDYLDLVQGFSADRLEFQLITVQSPPELKGQLCSQECRRQTLRIRHHGPGSIRGYLHFALALVVARPFPSQCLGDRGSIRRLDPRLPPGRRLRRIRWRFRRRDGFRPGGRLRRRSWPGTACGSPWGQPPHGRRGDHRECGQHPHEDGPTNSIRFVSDHEIVWTLNISRLLSRSPNR